MGERTEYSIGAINPLGGFGKISGMIDESMDFESNVGRTSTLGVSYSKPAWQRLIRDAGRDFVNVITGIITSFSWFTRTAKLIFLGIQVIENRIVAR